MTSAGSCSDKVINCIWSGNPRDQVGNRPDKVSWDWSSCSHSVEPWISYFSLWLQLGICLPLILLWSTENCYHVWRSTRKKGRRSCYFIFNGLWVYLDNKWIPFLHLLNFPYSSSLMTLALMFLIMYPGEFANLVCICAYFSYFLQLRWAW